MSFSALEAARECPDRAALIVDAAAWSYGRLAGEVSRAISWLRAQEPIASWRATDEPPRVALLARPHPDAVVALLALVELGLPAVLLHPRATDAERRTLSAVAGASLLLDGAEPFDGPPPSSRPERTFSHERALPDDDRCLGVLWTSGTTGAPRAAVLSRAAFAFAVRASEANLPLGHEDRWLLALPWAHVGGLSVLLRCLRARCAVVLPAATGAASPGSSAHALAQTLARDRVTVLSLVPTQLARLLDLEPAWSPPPQLRAILVGGAAASPDLLARARARALPVLPTYGLTECGSQVATLPPGTPDPDNAGCGPPLPGIEVRITAAGAIAIRAPSLLTGYLDPAGLRSPLDGEGFLTTADAGRIDERGFLHVLGRIDDVIVRGGEKIHPLEVEAALERAPGVAAAVAFGVADAEWGQVVAAALTATRGGPPSDEEVAAALRPLAGFKRPRWIAWLPALSAGPSGKIDRRAVATAALPHLRPLLP